MSHLLTSVFDSHESDGFRGLVYDSKQDIIPKLYSCGLRDRVVIMHPYDARCRPWDLATDLDDSLSARQFAQILIPDSPGRAGDSGFFEESCRDIIAVVIQVLSRCVAAERWTFRDLINSLLYPENLEMLLALRQTRTGQSFPSARRIWEAYFDPELSDDRTRGNIRSTLNAKLSAFETVAAAWENSKNPPFSLKKWQAENQNTFIVLGNDEAARATIDPLNQAIFQRAAGLTLARPEGDSTLTWFFLDEVREAGRLDALNSLLLKGRSKGACVVLSFQDIEGLRQVYGDHLANEIVANCSNVALLRTNSPETAEWASKMFGKFLVTERDRSTGMTGSEVSSSETRRLVERQPVQAGELLYLPLPSKAGGLYGFFKDAMSDSTEARLFRIASTPSYDIFGPEHAFEPLNRADLLLEPWTNVDLNRLGLTKKSPPPKIQYRAVEAAPPPPPQSTPTTPAAPPPPTKKSVPTRPRSD